MNLLKHLIRDVAGIVVPQYLKEDESDFEAVKGKDGALNVNATVVGSLANNQTDAIVLANTNVLASDYTPVAYQNSKLVVATSVSGVLSLVLDGVAITLNSGIALVAGAAYAFDIPLMAGSTYNLQLSVGATTQVKWQVI